MELEQLCRFAVDSNASDLFIKAYAPPSLRVHGRIVPTDLPETVLQGPQRKSSFTIDAPMMSLADLEREYILKVLNYTQWQKKRASEILAINASTLYRKLLAYGITEKPGAEDEGQEKAA